jgi:hypothetical protein
MQIFKIRLSEFGVRSNMSATNYCDVRPRALGTQGEAAAPSCPTPPHRRCTTTAGTSTVLVIVPEACTGTGTVRHEY